MGGIKESRPDGRVRRLGFDLRIDFFVEVVKRGRWLVYVFIGEIAFDEGQDASGAFVERDAEGVDIGAAVDGRT